MYEELRTIKIEGILHAHPLAHTLPAESVTLEMMYKDGWWITEIFGSTAVLVKRTYSGKCKHPRFRLLCKTINVDQITPAAKKIIKKVQNEQWQKYKGYLLKPKKRYDKSYD